MGHAREGDTGAAHPVYGGAMEHRDRLRAQLPSLLLVTAALFTLSFMPCRAAADRDRPLYAGFGGGPYFDLDWGNVHGRVSGEFGWHFGREDTGFVMAVEVATNFGPDYFMFLGGLRLGGDIEVHGNHRYGIILRPSGLVGAAFRDNNYDGGRNWYGVFVVQPAFDIRFAVADRALVIWLRPVAFDIFFDWDRPGRAWAASAAYHAMIGLDFQF